LPHHYARQDSDANVDLDHLRYALAEVNQIKPISDSISTEKLRELANEHLKEHYDLLKTEKSKDNTQGGIDQMNNFRFFSILDGASITNEDTTSDAVHYFGYTRPGGSWIIMRVSNQDTPTPSYHYYTGADIPKPFQGAVLTKYTLAWANKENLPYIRSGELPAQ